MSTLKKVGIVGAGNMGAGIAQKIAQEGCEVVLNDVTQDALAGAIENIKKTLQQGVKPDVHGWRAVMERRNQNDGADDDSHTE